MNDIPQRLVREALAFHLGVEPEAIESTHRLAQDWSLLPLDLVLIFLRLEELGRVEFPFQELEHVATVGDLAKLVGHWIREGRGPMVDAGVAAPRGSLRNVVRGTGTSRYVRRRSGPRLAYSVVVRRRNRSSLIGLSRASPLRFTRPCPRLARRKSPSTRWHPRRRRLY